MRAAEVLPAVLLSAAAVPFDAGFAAGILIGAATAFVLFRMTERTLAGALEAGKAVRPGRLALGVPAKAGVTGAGLLLAAAVSTTAVAGLFAGVAAALAGKALAARKDA